MKTYALAGASSRALGMYAQPIADHYQDTSRLVGVFDLNQTRARYISQQCGGFPVYADFDAMLAKARPDCVIVTTVDRFHHEYIIRSLEAGCDGYIQKPIDIDLLPQQVERYLRKK